MRENIMPSENHYPLGHLRRPSPMIREAAASLCCASGQGSDGSPKAPNGANRAQAIHGSTEPKIERAAPWHPTTSNAGSSPVAGVEVDYRNRPMPAIEIDLGHAMSLMQDPEWWLQEQYRGELMLIRKTMQGVEGIDEEGRAVALPAAIAAAAECILPTWIIEGVRMGDRFVAVDLLLFERLGFQTTPYWLRLGALRELLPSDSVHLLIAETATKTRAKGELLERLRKAEKKGLVFRKATAERMSKPSLSRAFLMKHAFDRSA